MVRLICRGSKTKITTRWAGVSCSQWLQALKNGTDLGEFSSAAAAKAQAEMLLTQNRSSVYLVLHEDGRLTDWVYDLDEKRRIDCRRSWINAFLTAPILALITAGTAALLGMPVFSRHGLFLIAASVGVYLFMRACQNAIEALVAWFLSFLLFLLCFSLSGPAKRRHSPQPVKIPISVSERSAWAWHPGERSNS